MVARFFNLEDWVAEQFGDAHGELAVSGRICKGGISWLYDRMAVGFKIASS